MANAVVEHLELENRHCMPLKMFHLPLRVQLFGHGREELLFYLFTEAFFTRFGGVSKPAKESSLESFNGSRVFRGLGDLTMDVSEPIWYGIY